MTRLVRTATALLALVSVLLVAVPVFAYLYCAPVAITENTSTSYDMLPVLWTQNNDWLADNGFMNSTANDTRVQTLGGLNKPWMAADNKTLTAIPVPADSQTNLYFVTGENEASAMDIIVGYGGYFTVDDDVGLELSDNFSISIDGYIDTSASAVGANITSKAGVFRTYIGDTGNITATIATASPTAPANSTSIYSSTADGFTSVADAVYNTAWAQANGETLESGLNYFTVGQVVSGAYYIYRSGLYFPETADTPDDANILSANISLYGETDGSAKDFLITVQNGQPTYPHDTLRASDYNKSNYSGDGGSLTTVGFSTVGYNTLELNATGISWINLTGTTKLCLRSSEDIAGSAPTDNEYVSIYSSDEAGTSKDPYLIITYQTIDGSIYTVSASGISSGEHTRTVDRDNALHFNGGANCYAQVASNTDLDITTEDFSIVFWANPTDKTADEYAVSKQKASAPFGGYYVNFKNTTGYLRAAIDSVEDTESSVVYSVDCVDSGWHHYAFTADRDSDTGLNLYRDGVLVATDNAIPRDGESLSNSNYFYIGAYRNPIVSSMDGSMWGMKFYKDRVLTGSEIWEDYMSGDIADDSNLSGEWFLNDGAGGTAADTSGNGYDATVSVATWTDNGGVMRLSIDGVVEGVGIPATVPDNDNDWVFMSNATPYFNSCTITVDGVLQAWYEPNDIISGTTLPDRQGGDNDGTIVWGANPAGVGATLGSFTSSGQPSIGVASDTSTSDLLPVVGGSDWRPDAGVSATLQANPIRPIVTAISDNTTLSEYQVWVWLGGIFTVFITALVASRVRGHHLITGIAVTAIILLLVIWTVFPYWTLVIAAIAVVLGLVSERSPTL